MQRSVVDGGWYRGCLGGLKQAADGWAKPGKAEISSVSDK